jgi:hypothetical protein
MLAEYKKTKNKVGFSKGIVESRFLCFFGFKLEKEKERNNFKAIKHANLLHNWSKNDAS